MWTYVDINLATLWSNYLKLVDQKYKMTSFSIFFALLRLGFALDISDRENVFNSLGMLGIVFSKISTKNGGIEITAKS